MIYFFVNFFLTLSEKLSEFERDFFDSVLKIFILRVQRIFLVKNFFSKNSLLFWNVEGIFLAGMPKLFSTCREEYFDEKYFFGKFISV